MDEVLAFIAVLLVGVVLWGAFVALALLAAISAAVYYGVMGLSWLSGQVWKRKAENSNPSRVSGRQP